MYIRSFFCYFLPRLNRVRRLLKFSGSIFKAENPHLYPFGDHPTAWQNRTNWITKELTIISSCLTQRQCPKAHGCQASKSYSTSLWTVQQRRNIGDEATGTGVRMAHPMTVYLHAPRRTGIDRTTIRVTQRKAVTTSMWMHMHMGLSCVQRGLIRRRIGRRRFAMDVTTSGCYRLLTRCLLETTCEGFIPKIRRWSGFALNWMHRLPHRARLPSQTDTLASDAVECSQESRMQLSTSGLCMIVSWRMRAWCAGVNLLAKITVWYVFIFVVLYAIFWGCVT